MSTQNNHTPGLGNHSSKPKRTGLKNVSYCENDTSSSEEFNSDSNSCDESCKDISEESSDSGNEYLQLISSEDQSDSDEDYLPSSEKNYKKLAKNKVRSKLLANKSNKAVGPIQIPGSVSVMTPGQLSSGMTYFGAPPKQPKNILPQVHREFLPIPHGFESAFQAGVNQNFGVNSGHSGGGTLQSYLTPIQGSIIDESHQGLTPADVLTVVPPTDTVCDMHEPSENVVQLNMDVPAPVIVSKTKVVKKRKITNTMQLIKEITIDQHQEIPVKCKTKVVKKKFINAACEFDEPVSKCSSENVQKSDEPLSKCRSENVQKSINTVCETDEPLSKCSSENVQKSDEPLSKCSENVQKSIDTINTVCETDEPLSKCSSENGQKSDEPLSKCSENVQKSIDIINTVCETDEPLSKCSSENVQKSDEPLSKCSENVQKSIDTINTVCETDESLSKCSSENVQLDKVDVSVEVIPSKTKVDELLNKKSTKKKKKKKDVLTIQEVCKLFRSKYKYQNPNENSRPFYRQYGTIVKSSCKKYLIYRCKICAELYEFYDLDCAKDHFEKEHSNLQRTETGKNDEDKFVDYFKEFYKCNQCGMTQFYLHCFVRHMDSLHNGELRKYSCGKCHFFTFDKWLFKSHKLKSHQARTPEKNKILPEKTKCHLCHLSVVNIKKHMKQMHCNKSSSGTGRIKCQHCPITFSSVGLALQHRNKVHLFPEYDIMLCKECGRTFKKSGFRQHIHSYHGHGQTKQLHYECSLCKSKYVTKHGLDLHMTRHHGDGKYGTGKLPYSCADCDRSFSRENNLLSHIRKEHDPTCEEPEKNHLCETCGKSFVLKFLLDRHVVVHTKEKKFVCATCNKGFTQMDSLKSHQVVHTGIKPFECGKCGNKYSQKYPLTQHIKKHHPE